MLGTVLVPLDGSRFAETALPAARRITDRARGRLHLVIADEPALAGVHPGAPGAALATVTTNWLIEDEKYLRQTASGLGRVGEGPVRARVVTGATGPAICDEAGRIGADLIIMATHARKPLGRALLGSVADHVVRHAGRPVLLIKPDLDLAGRELRLARILVPVDLTGYSEAILQSVTDLAALVGAGVTLLTVVAPRFGLAEPEMPPPVPQHPAIVARRLDEAHARLDRLAARAGAGVRTRVVVSTTPAAGILEVLAEDGFDLVALTTHGEGGLQRLLKGSVADRLIRDSEKPVLVYHPAY